MDDVARVRIVLPHVDFADVHDQRETLVVAQFQRLELCDRVATPLEQFVGLGAVGDDRPEGVEPFLLQRVGRGLVLDVRSEATQDIFEQISRVDALEEDLLHLDFVGFAQPVGQRHIDVVGLGRGTDDRDLLEAFESHELAHQFGILAEPAGPAGRGQHHEVLRLDLLSRRGFDLLLQEADRVTNHAFERVTDLGVDVLARHFVATRCIGRQGPGCQVPKKFRPAAAM